MFRAGRILGGVQSFKACGIPVGSAGGKLLRGRSRVSHGVYTLGFLRGIAGSLRGRQHLLPVILHRLGRAGSLPLRQAHLSRLLSYSAAASCSSVSCDSSLKLSSSILSSSMLGEELGLAPSAGEFVAALYSAAASSSVSCDSFHKAVLVHAVLVHALRGLSSS